MTSTTITDSNPRPCTDANEPDPRGDGSALGFDLIGIVATPAPVIVRRSDTPLVSIVGPSERVVGAREKETLVRVRASLASTGIRLHHERIDVTAPNGGAALDLACAAAVLQARGVVPPVRGTAFAGELALSGKIRPVRGILPIVRAAKALELREIVVPAGNAQEAALVEGIRIVPAETIADVVEHLNGRTLPKQPTECPVPTPCDCDMGDVRGQDEAIGAIVAAVNEGKSVLMVGPSGNGKTFIARRIASRMPPMSRDEILSASAVHSAAGLLDEHRPAITVRPFRAPHHTVSDAGLLGGGVHARPGEASLAAHGVLFLDEVQEFRTVAVVDTLKASRRGSVSVRGHEMPASTTVVAAASPCACGGYGGQCCCSDAAKQRYEARLAKLRRLFDVAVTIKPVDLAKLREQNKTV